MPKEDAHLIRGYPRKGYGHASITAEEAAGIGILIVILGILLLLSCWYCRRRIGYRTVQGKSLHPGTQNTLRKGHPYKELAHQESKLHLKDVVYGPVVPNAPHTYEKHFVQQSPPPYSP
ncbi:PREDICTED: melanoma antigen recognized by T-cells 1 [Chrysochloris asiatica]|uniref:Melanoma antigen recognized by T-cells 1 n=1 Tax=Chrysochloris asiatica TaxID=185453 RepID=A0A9B0TM12_CHRAS|nr:PREDICTED: melanoma antigen recognized by T-cells 1 [Chrysochloris asiatica]